MFARDAQGNWTSESRPFYNAVWFESQLPRARYQSQTDMDAKGMGVGTLAGGDSKRVALVIWNYQWKNKSAKKFTLNLINLPADFRTSPVHVKLQAVRLTRDQGDPEVELDETIAPTSGSSR